METDLTTELQKASLTQCGSALVQPRLVLRPVSDEMKFADFLRVTVDEEGRRSFYFIDSTGFVHSSFRDRDWLACVPEGAITAAQMPNRRWYWIIQQNSGMNDGLSQ